MNANCEDKSVRYAKYLIFALLLVGNTALSDNSISLVDAENIVPNPLRVGEKLTYDIRWKKIPAGKRTDWIVKGAVVNGENVYRIQSEMKTRALFRLYKFRSRQETHLHPTTLSPIRFENYVQDRKFQVAVKIDFHEGKADYERVSRPNPKAPQKRETKVLEIPPGTQDELSIIYFLRSKQLELGETYFFPLLAKGKVHKATLAVERTEFVKNKVLGTVKTLVLRSSEGNRFWITDDERRLPVKLEFESKRGTVVSILTEVEPEVEPAN
ncbi:hypothetical protein C6503_04195 [Candidatus Poribacteria bacterium]|nr:MAG: hypothetical protein C6503_04195 [Candidatus Poribacteria bacterium]